MPEGKTDVCNYFIYCLLAIAYFLACFLRTSSGIIVPDVSKSIMLTSAGMGLVSGMFFYGYTLTQPFCGKLCDERGPLVIESLSLLLFAAGLYVFAVAKTIFLLCAARFIIGVGAGPTFSGILVYQAKSFPPEMFSKLMGTTIMLGHIGGVIAITPLGWAVDKWGYSKIHLFLAGVGVFVAVTLYHFRHTFKYTAGNQVKKRSALSGFIIIYRSLRLKALLSLWSVGMLLQMSLIGLWGVTWVEKVCMIPVNRARLCMSAGGLGVLIGAVFCGMYGNKLSKDSKFIRALCAALCVVLFTLAACIELKSPWIIPFLVSLSLGIILGSINVLSNVFLYKIVGSDQVGIVTGANNVVLFFIVLISQWISGLFIQIYDERFKSPCISSYAAFFLIICVFDLLSLFVLYKVSLHTEVCCNGEKNN